MRGTIRWCGNAKTPTNCGGFEWWSKLPKHGTAKCTTLPHSNSKVLEKEKRRYKLKWVERHIQDLDITSALKEHTYVGPTRRYGYSMRAKESNWVNQIYLQVYITVYHAIVFHWKTITRMHITAVNTKGFSNNFQRLQLSIYTVAAIKC